MTTYKKHGVPIDQELQVIVSDPVTVATTIDLDDLPNLPHVQVGAQFFSDAAGETPATPGAGSIAVTIETVATQVLEAAPGGGAITAATPTTLSWDLNTSRVNAVPTGVTTATHWRLVVVMNAA